MMDRIIAQTEADPYYREVIEASHTPPRANTADAIGYAMRSVAGLLDVAATVAYTSSGYSALRMARERPGAPIIGMTPRRATARRLALVWGVHPVLCDEVIDVARGERARVATAPKGLRRARPDRRHLRRACRSARPAPPTCCASRRSSENHGTIRDVRGFELLDSRGNPTVAAQVAFGRCSQGFAASPVRRIDRRARGARVARRRPARYRGKGVSQAVAHVNGELRRRSLASTPPIRRHRTADDRSRRHADQGTPGCQRDPRGLAGARQGGCGVGRRAVVPARRRRPRTRACRCR